VRVLHHDLAGACEAHRLRAAGALDQALADDTLERRDLLADRGLRVPELGGRAVERRLARDCVEREKVAQLDTDPSVRPQHVSMIDA
jgi:hypothetical protein